MSVSGNGTYAQHGVTGSRDRENPKVTVVIAAFNAARTLDRPLDSLEAQTFQDWEAIVVDDGSIDSTRAIAAKRAHANTRIRIVSKLNGGVSSARNLGLKMARGEWIVFLDADDRLSRKALASFVRETRHPSAPDIVCGFTDMIDENGRAKRYPRNRLQNPVIDLASECGLAIHGQMSRTALVRSVGGFDESLSSSEDWDLWQKLARAGGRFHPFDERVAFYHSEAGSLTKKPGATARNHLEVLRRGVYGLDINDPATGQAARLLRHDIAYHQLSFIMWAGSRAILAGEDPVAFLDLVSPRPLWDIDLDLATSLMADSAANFLAAAPRPAAEVWTTYGPELRRFLSEALPGDRFQRARGVLYFGVKQRMFGAEPWSTDEHFERARGVAVSLDKPPGPLEPADADVVAAQLFLAKAPVGLAIIPAPHRLEAEDVATSIDQCLVTTPLAQAVRGRSILAQPSFWAAAAPALLEPRGIAPRPAAIRAMIRHRAKHAARKGLRAVGARATGHIARSHGGAKPDYRKRTGFASSVPILMYHRIADDSRAGLERYSVSPKAFAEQMRYLREDGYWTPTVTQWADAIRTCKPLPGKPVLITFDDGYCDFVDAGWPELVRNRLRASMFIVTDKVGATADWEDLPGEAPPLMDWDRLADLVELGLEVGSHSATHAPMQQIPVAKVFEEGKRSRAAIRANLGVEPSLFCFPYGQADRAARVALHQCGYSVGLSVVSDISTLSSDPMFLPRLTVEGDDTIETFARKLHH